MVTPEQLAEKLRTVSVEALARETGMATKTIYRLRHQRNSPRLETVQVLLAAVEKLTNEADASARQAA